MSCEMQEEPVSRSSEVYAFFDRLGIPYRKVEHPPMFTQADNDKYRPKIDAVIFKNLFLRNKNKSRYYLLSLPLYKKADLLLLQHILGESRLSFGVEAMLEEKLNIKAGSVSVLNIIGVKKTDVIFLIDRSALEYEMIGVHPNDNTATIIFPPGALSKIFDFFGIEYRFLEL